MNAGNAEAPGYDHTADEDDGICENESQAESVTRSAATTDAGRAGILIKVPFTHNSGFGRSR